MDKKKSAFDRAKKKTSISIMVIAFMIVAVFHLGSVNNEINGLGGDNADYILLAKSLTSGNGYTGPGKAPHTHFPPGFPILLMPAYILFGVNFTAFHILVVLCELGAIVLIFFFLSRLWGQLPSALVCLVFALNPFVNQSLVRILTEYPYLMITSAALLLADRTHHEPGERWTEFLWLPVLITGAYFIRLAGLSILVSFIIYRIFQGRWKSLLWNLPIVTLPPLLWKFRTQIIGNDAGNISSAFLKDMYDPSKGAATISDIITRIMDNVVKVGELASQFLFPFIRKPGGFILIFVLATLLVGLWANWRKHGWSLVNIYVPVYIGMLLLWPWLDNRKVLVVVPFLFYFFFLGLAWTADLIQKHIFPNGQPEGEKKHLKWSIPVLVVTGAIVLLVQLPQTMDIYKLRSKSAVYPSKSSKTYGGLSIDWSHFFGAYYWAKSGMLAQNVRPWADFLFVSQSASKLTPAGSLIISRKPSLTALYGDRPAINFPFHRDFQKQRVFIIENEIDFILMDGMFQQTAQYLLPYINANRSAFTIIKRSNSAVLLRVDRELL